jgi:hypothetical protein
MPPENQQNPMSLENLPAYLQSIKEKGDSGTAPIVNTGQILVDEPSSGWFSQVAVALAACILLAGASISTYYIGLTQNFTVMLDTNNPENIAKIISDEGGEVLSVQQKEGSNYEVKIAIKKNKNSLLESLRKNKNIKTAE